MIVVWTSRYNQNMDKGDLATYKKWSERVCEGKWVWNKRTACTKSMWRLRPSENENGAAHIRHTWGLLLRCLLLIYAMLLVSCFGQSCVVVNLPACWDFPVMCTPDGRWGIGIVLECAVVILCVFYNMKMRIVTGWVGSSLSFFAVGLTLWTQTQSRTASHMK